MAKGLGSSAPAKIWKNLQTSGKFKDLRLFFIFLLVSGVFWLIMALNDVGQTDFQVKVELVDVPDSVTFIEEPPAFINVSVRNKGTSLLRRKFMDAPVLHVPFAEYSENGRLRVSSSAVMAQLRAIFGTASTINVNSRDSISVSYTTLPGKLVPVRVDADITTALGKVVNGRPKVDVREVKVFSSKNIQDTIMYVTTEPIVRRNLSDPLTVSVNIRPMKGVRFEPSTVTVTIPVEPLENRKAYVPVTPVGVPKGESLVLFPQKVEVSYLVPMSSKDDLPSDAFKVVAEYADVSPTETAMVKVKLVRTPEGVTNATLQQDSIEYTIIRSVQ